MNYEFLLIKACKSEDCQKELFAYYREHYHTEADENQMRIHLSNNLARIVERYKLRTLDRFVDDVLAAHKSYNFWRRDDKPFSLEENLFTRLASIIALTKSEEFPGYRTWLNEQPR